MISSIAARARRNYQRLSELATTTTTTAHSEELHSAVTANNNTLTPPTTKNFSVVILDTAQTKFSVSCDQSWTVKQLKIAGHAIHMVEPSSQRLIYRGRMLNDDQTLEDAGIVEDGTILHLFPKPKVVIASSNDTANVNRNENSGSIDISSDTIHHNPTANSAHIPRIVLDADETARNADLIILSSHEIFEAQHRVRLLSLMLLVYSFMELLNLFSRATYTPSNPTSDHHNDDRGIPPGDPTDTNIVDSFYLDDNFSNTDDMMTWHNSDYFDLIVCILGVYVAKLGLRATSETTLNLVRRYFIFLIFAGVAWITWYFFTTVDNQKRLDGENGYSETSAEIYSNAAIASVLPFLLWITCFMRAWQFQELVRDAEQEADERMNRLAQGHNNTQIQVVSGDFPYNQPTAIPTFGRRENDLELQVDSRRILI